MKDLQKVFIFAAGNDMYLYLDVLSEDLFRAQPNISVRYPVKDDETPEDEESVDSMMLLSQAHRLFAEIENSKGDLAEEAEHLTADTELLHKLSGMIGNHNVYLK